MIQENQKISEVISKQVFNSMYQVMRKGWSREELKAFIESTKDSFEGSSHNIEIYRGDAVDELFGKIKQKEMSGNILEVFNSKKKKSENNAR